jgi:hypothetical protein
MTYLVIHFTPDRPILELRPESDELVYDVLTSDGPGEAGGRRRLAVNVFSFWIFGADDHLLGVEVHVFPEYGVLEAHPEVLRLPYADYEAPPYLRVWFTDRRDGETSSQDDFVGAFYTLPDGGLVAAVGTSRLTGVGEMDQLAALCSGH